MDLSLMEWLLIAGIAIAILRVIAKHTPWEWDDKLVAMLVQVLTTVRAHQSLIEKVASRAKGDGVKKDRPVKKEGGHPDNPRSTPPAP